MHVNSIENTTDYRFNDNSKEINICIGIVKNVENFR